MHHPTDRITHTTAFVTPVVIALAGTRNSSMGEPHEGSIRRPTAPRANALPLSDVPLLPKRETDRIMDRNPLQHSYIWNKNSLKLWLLLVLLWILLYAISIFEIYTTRIYLFYWCKSRCVEMKLHLSDMYYSLSQLLLILYLVYSKVNATRYLYPVNTSFKVSSLRSRSPSAQMFIIWCINSIFFLSHPLPPTCLTNISLLWGYFDILQ